jgi:hypothetical protein
VTGQSGNKAEQTQLFHEYPFSATAQQKCAGLPKCGGTYVVVRVLLHLMHHTCELLFALGIFLADWLDAIQWWRIMPQARGL